MKKALVILVALAFAAPLYADVEFAQAAPGEPITWISDGAGIVAMGLDVDMTSGAITGVVIDPCSFFNIFMDVAYDEEALDGYSYGEDNGNGPVAHQDGPGSTDLATDGASFAISMGGLGGESEPLDPAPTSGTITLSGTGAGTLGENELRGGVIDEDGNQVATNLDPTPLPFALIVPDCFQLAGIDVSDPPHYAEFLAAGSPKCWCYPTQCEGDANGDTEGGGILGTYHVGTIDIGVVAGAWKVTEPTKGPGITTVNIGGIPGACGDFDHATEGGGILGTFRVGSIDIGILAVNWKVTEPTKGPGIAKTCVPGNLMPPPAP